MANEYSRKETTHIDEVKRSAASSMQWLVEPLSKKGAATHPITHNNKLKFFICGQEGFGDIAAEIARAEKTIDLCCWGFDPGMELKRNSSTWPRGDTFGDLLIAAARRGVKVRLLVWKDWLGSKLVHNMPGHTHGTSPWFHRDDEAGANLINSRHSLELIRNFNKDSKKFKSKAYLRSIASDFPVDESALPIMAREEYCYSWFQAVIKGHFKNIAMCTRVGKSEAIRRSLENAPQQPRDFSKLEIERAGFLGMGTHHQKTILIDYAYKEGRRAVGYVMGLNSVTDYWDTAEHNLEEPLREAGGDSEKKESVQVDPPDPGFVTLKPYQDYACRIDAGHALVDVHINFVGAWARAGGDPLEPYPDLELLADKPPAALLRKAEPGDSTVQVVRTQPEENDKSIQEAYWQATAMAATTAGYIYLENQYLQCEHWAQHLLECRRKTISKWRSSSKKAGKKREDMPILYLFIVTPVPEREQMIPRTYDTLATFGEHKGMEGQDNVVEKWNKKMPEKVRSGYGTVANAPHKLPDVVEHANGINKPNALELEEKYGLKVCVAMLNTCDFESARWRYREIYIHSKLMISNDVFFTLGSANTNQRSFAVDSEINVAVQDPKKTKEIRKRVWKLLSGSKVSGGDGGPKDLATAFRNWSVLMKENLGKRNSDELGADQKKLLGFILPLEDKRSSLIRLG